MRSSSGRPDAWYFLAIETTRRRFDCTNVRWASSPVAGGAPQLALLGRGEVLRAPEQLLARGVAVLDLLRETDLVVLGEERVLPDVGEVEPDEIFLVPLDTLLRHPGNPLLSWSRRRGRRSRWCGGPNDVAGRMQRRRLRLSTVLLPPVACNDTGRVKSLHRVCGKAGRVERRRSGRRGALVVGENEREHAAIGPSATGVMPSAQAR